MEITEEQVRAWVKGVVYYGPDPPPEFIWQLATMADRDQSDFDEHYGALKYMTEHYPWYAKSKEELIDEYHSEEYSAGNL